MKNISIIILFLISGCAFNKAPTAPDWSELSPFSEPINSEKEIKSFNENSLELQ